MNPRVEETILETMLEDEEDAFYRGVAKLDDEIPNWWEKIDLKTFDIESSTYCVLGQLGGFGLMQSYLGFESIEETKAHGFEALGVDRENCKVPGVVSKQYAKLQELWYDEIESRQRNADASLVT
jgi:hypothetical protein